MMSGLFESIKVLNWGFFSLIDLKFIRAILTGLLVFLKSLRCFILAGVDVCFGFKQKSGVESMVLKGL